METKKKTTRTQADSLATFYTWKPQQIKESMVLILSTSAIIGAKTSAVPHFLTGLPFWIVASGNIGTVAENRQLLKDGIGHQI